MATNMEGLHCQAHRLIVKILTKIAHWAIKDSLMPSLLFGTVDILRKSILTKIVNFLKVSCRHLFNRTRMRKNRVKWKNRKYTESDCKKIYFQKPRNLGAYGGCVIEGEGYCEGDITRLI